MKAVNVVIAGGKGRMGAMFAARLGERGHRVKGLEPPLGDQRVFKACREADLLLLCIPAEAFNSVLEELGPHLPEQAVMADIASVKVLPMAAMRDSGHKNIVGTHPLFGPAPSPGASVAMVREPASAPGSFELVREIFQDMGFACFETTAEKHDKAMAAVQGLNFISSVAYFAALAHDDDLLPFITPSFRRRLEAARKMLTEDGKLFSGIFEANPYGQDAVKQFRSYLNVAAGGDVDLLLERAGWWWSKAGQQQK